MNSENIINDLEAILDDQYPKSSYEGDFITAENTVEGLRGNVTAEEETTVVVCNRNLIDMAKAVGLYNCKLSEIDEENEKIIFVRSSTINPSINLTGLNLPAGVYRFYAYFRGSTSFKDENNNTILTISGVKYLNEPYNESIELTEKCTRIDFGLDIDNYNDGSYDEDTDSFYVRFSNFILQAGEDEINYVRHRSQEHIGTDFEIKTYSDITHIYNADDVNMSAEIRVKEETT